MTDRVANRTVPASLNNEARPTQNRELVREVARLDPGGGNQLVNCVVTFTEQFENTDAGRMTQDSKEVSLGPVEGS